MVSPKYASQQNFDLLPSSKWRSWKEANDFEIRSPFAFDLSSLDLNHEAMFDMESTESIPYFDLISSSSLTRRNRMRNIEMVTLHFEFMMRFAIGDTFWYCNVWKVKQKNH